VKENHLWVPDLDLSKGGVQAFSHFLRQALLTITPRRRVRTFAKRSSERQWLRSQTPVFATSLLWAGIQSRPELVISSHVNFLPVARLLKKLRGTQYVGVAHGIEVWANERPSLRGALRAADLILCVSRHTRDRVGSEQGIPPERLKVLPNTFEAHRFAPGPKSEQLRSRYALPSNAKVIFSFGRLSATERYKGFDRMLTALPAIRRQVPDAHYLIGGSGDDRPNLERLAHEAGVAAWVRFTGFIPADELRAHYQLCDVFAMPSTGEGFGIVFLEAMACGKPVLAGNRDGSVEPLADGRFGALVDPLDISQIAATIADILMGRHVHPLMFQPEELRHQVVAEFGFDRFCERLASSLTGIG
jgi:glycosyltransferase involved in cell wall biosynthesis